MFKFVACFALGAEFAEASRVAVITEHELWSSTLEEVEDETAESSSTWTPIFSGLIRGGTDGSCPAGTIRVSSEDCPNVNGRTIDGETLSNRRFRVDCAAHFTPGEGCFMNTNNDVYATEPDCASAAARGGIDVHFAVCETSLVRGGTDGSCPAGTYRVDAQNCRRTSGHQLFGGDEVDQWNRWPGPLTLSDRAHRVSCAAHFVPGAGCFANYHGNVYSTAPECSRAVNVYSHSDPNSPQYNPGHFAVCAAGQLVRGGTDGSCPSGSTRVTAQDCANVNGLTLTDGTSLSTSAFRVDCAAHFTPSEGCFVNDRNNVYATSPDCASAEARGGIAIHHAVCVSFER